MTRAHINPLTARILAPVWAPHACATWPWSRAAPASIGSSEAFRLTAGLPARRADVAESMRIALFEPDIPQNTGTILRLAACLGIEAHIVEPAGFPVSDRAFRRAGMDYLDQVAITRHASWPAFEAWRAGAGARLILLTTSASMCYLDHIYRSDDVRGRRGYPQGVPEKVHRAADVRLVVPMRAGMRSLNVAMAAAIVVGEAMRQTKGL